MRIKKIFLSLLQSTPALLVIALVLIYCATLSPYVYNQLGGVFDANQTPAFLFLIGYSFVCLFALPALISGLFFNESLKTLGVRLPSGAAKTSVLICGALILLIPSIYALSKLPTFIHYYSLKEPTVYRLAAMSLIMPVYYFAEEFFFRGFLFLGLWHRVKWHSFWITEIIFTLSHSGKPGIEILLCIPASVIFNCLTIYTKSIYPAMIVHSLVGIFCVVIVNLGGLSH